MMIITCHLVTGITLTGGLLHAGGQQVVFEELEEDDVLQGNVLTGHALLAEMTDSAALTLLPCCLSEV